MLADGVYEALIDGVGRTTGEGGTVAASLRKVRLLARRRGLVVVVSDLLDGSDWPTELRRASLRPFLSPSIQRGCHCAVACGS